MAKGTIKKLIADREFGFIWTGNGPEVVASYAAVAIIGATLLWYIRSAKHWGRRTL